MNNIGDEKAAPARWNFCDGDEFVERYDCSECGKEIELNIEIFNEPAPEKCPVCGAEMYT